MQTSAKIMQTADTLPDKYFILTMNINIDTMKP